MRDLMEHATIAAGALGCGSKIAMAMPGKPRNDRLSEELRGYIQGLLDLAGRHIQRPSGELALRIGILSELALSTGEVRCDREINRIKVTWVPSFQALR